MVCCLNPDCQNPQNPDGNKFCTSCGAKLQPVLRSRYRIIKPLGQGGFGRTYLAEDIDKLNERCVVKQLAPTAQGSSALQKATQLFGEEARRLQQLGEHPQIPALYAYFEEDRRLYLVQQFIEGRDLKEELQQQGAFSEEKIWEVLNNLLPVLGFVHEHQVIHRDIKPQNIMRRSRNCLLVLIDFGASKELTATVMAKPGTSIGSNGYAPLEQMERGEAYPASDLFSLGATCFHLLTGISPFKLWVRSGYSWVGCWREYLKTPVSEKLGRVLDKLLQVNIERRYQSAEEVIGDLSSQTLVVSKLGRGDCRSISEAVGKAQTGTRILVQPGVYSEGVVIDKPVEIIGDGAREEIVIDCADSPCLQMRADYAVVRNLSVRGRAPLRESGDPNDSAIYVDQGCLVVGDCQITSETGAGIAIEGVKANPIVRRCKIYSGNSVGVWVFKNGQGTVEDCDIAGNAGVGVQISEGGNPVIRRCAIHDGKNVGVYVSEKGLGTVEDCDIFGNAGAGVLIMQGGNPVIRRCKINRNGYKAVWVLEKGAGTIADCDLTGNSSGAWDIGSWCKVQRTGNKE